MKVKHDMVRFALVWAALVCLGMSGLCRAASAPTHASGEYPVVIENCGHGLRFQSAPKRVVTLYPPATELLLALGLKERIVGAAYTEAEPVLPKYEADYRELKSLSTFHGVPREIMLSVRPDLVVDNQPGGFYNAASGFATREELQDAGAQIYTLNMNCESGTQANLSIEDLFVDIRNMGRIFGVSQRAERLIKEMQSRIDHIRAKVKGMPPFKVLIYDVGQGPLNIIGGRSTRFGVFKELGCINAFPDFVYGPMSIEQVAVSDADYFIVLGYYSPGTATSQERMAFIKKTFGNSPAVQNGRVFIIPYNYMNPGLQNIEGLEFLARHIYPEAFK